MNIVHVTPRPDFMLLIESDEGSSGIFDVRPYLALEAFRPLQDAEAFAKVQNGRYFIEWACGADLSADTIFAKWQCCSANDVHARASSDLAHHPAQGR